MNTQEVKALGLWKFEKITRFLELIDPDYVAVVIADCHTGSRGALNPVSLTMMNGAKIVADEISQEIEGHFDEFWTLASHWNPTQAFFLGDLISACGSKLRSQHQDIIPTIDEQTRASIQLLTKVLRYTPTIKRKIFIDGSGYHDSLDSKQHREIASGVDGEYISGGYIVTSISDTIVALGHKTLNKAQYQSGIAEKDNYFKGFANAVEALPDIKITIGAHHHKWLDISTNGLRHILIPAWQGFYALKGSIGYIGRYQPDIGGMILVAKEGNFMTIPYIFKIQTVRVNC